MALYSADKYNKYHDKILEELNINMQILKQKNMLYGNIECHYLQLVFSIKHIPLDISANIKFDVGHYLVKLNNFILLQIKNYNELFDISQVVKQLEKQFVHCNIAIDNNLQGKKVLVNYLVRYFSFLFIIIL